MLSNKLGCGLLLALALGGCAHPQTQAVDKPAPAVRPAPPHLVSVSLDPTERYLEAGKPARLEVRLRLHADALPGRERPPVNLALAIDTSGSMEGQAIADAKAACLAMIDALADGDRVAVVTYDTDVAVLVPSTALDAQSRKRIRADVERMTAQGTTNMALGLAQALEQAEKSFLRSGVNRVVLLGDGVPNDSGPLTELAQRAGKEDISITALGLGRDYDETLMGRIAALSGGRFHQVRESSEVAAVLEREVLHMTRTVARGAVLDLAAGPGVVIEEVVGRPTVRSARGVELAIGDLSEEAQRDIILRVSAPARQADAIVELIDAQLVWQDAVVDGGSLKDRAFLALRTTADPQKLASAHDAAVELSAARASVASLVLQAIAAARAAKLGDALAIVDRAEKLARERGRDLADATLEARAAEMTALRRSLPLVTPLSAAEAVGARPIASEPAMEEADAVRNAHSAALDMLQGS